MKCAICTCVINKGEVAMFLNCHHLFHKYCLCEKKTCPICE